MRHPVCITLAYSTKAKVMTAVSMHVNMMGAGCMAGCKRPRVSVPKHRASVLAASFVPMAGYTKSWLLPAIGSFASNRFRVTAHATLFDNTPSIQPVTLEQVEQLYLSLPDRTNDKHTMLVLYAPWCSHCKAMEPQVRLLAEGLQHESQQLSVKALDCSDAATSAFVKEVLGVPALPAFCVFPQQSRTFYKFKGQTRDAQSLLKFLNMVCNQSTDKLWELSAVAGEAAAASTSPVRVTSVSAQPSAPLSGLALPAPALTAVGVAAALCAVAAIAAVMKGAKRSGEQAAGSSDVPATTPAASEQRSIPELVQDIDTSLTRMLQLMLRLLRARLGLIVSPVDDPVPAAKAPPAVDVEAVSSTASAAGTAQLDSGSLAGGMRRGGATVAAAVAVPVAAAAMDVPAAAAPAWQGDSLPASEAFTAPQLPFQKSPSGVASSSDFRQTMDAETAMSSRLPGQGLESQLTHQMVNVSGVNADRVLALLAEEGEDVGRALHRLLEQQDVQVNVEAMSGQPGAVASGQPGSSSV